MNEIGEMLRLARENSGVSISEVSKDLNIKEEILENIEAGRTGAFKDIVELKNCLTEYAKYLGLDSTQIIDEFNEYMFEYTSKIPIKEIEKQLQNTQTIKREVISPYTKQPKKHSKNVYILIYSIIIMVIFMVVVWSIKEIVSNQKVSTVISYVK